VLDRLEQYDAARQLLGEHEDLRLLADSTRQRLIESRWELLDLFVAQTARYLESGLKRRLFEEERFQVAADRVLRARFSALLEFCASFESLIAGDLTGEDADEVRRLLADTNDASLVALSVFDGKSRVGNGHWASRGLGMSRWGNWLSYIDSGVLPERDIRNLP